MLKALKILGILFAAAVLTVQAQVVKKAKLVSGPDSNSSAVVSPALPVLNGPKKLIAVHAFENKVENKDNDWWRDPKLGEGMSDMLVTALMNTNYFIVLEREQLQDAVLKEQDLAATGRTTKTGHAQMGGVLQAQIMVQGAITLFAENSKGKAGAGGLSFQGITVGLGGGGSESQVGVDIRLIDTYTGQVLAAKSCKGFAKNKARGLAIGLAGTSNGHPGAIGFGGADFEKTPLADATRDAINACVNYIVTEMNKVPWAGKVLKVSPEGVYINCGERNNVHEGNVFSVYKVGEKFVDPDTGEDLGSEEKYLGKIKIVTVKDKLSICTNVEGSGFDKGNVVRWSQG